MFAWNIIVVDGVLEFPKSTIDQETETLPGLEPDLTSHGQYVSVEIRDRNSFEETD